MVTACSRIHWQANNVKGNGHPKIDIRDHQKNITHVSKDFGTSCPPPHPTLHKRNSIFQMRIRANNLDLGFSRNHYKLIYFCEVDLRGSDESRVPPVL